MTERKKEESSPPAAAQDVAIDAWFAKYFQGLSPHLSAVEFYNAAHAAKEDLKQILATQ